MMNSVGMNPFNQKVNQKAVQQPQKTPQAQQGNQQQYNAGSSSQGGLQPGKNHFSQFQKNGHQQGAHALDPSKSTGSSHQVNKTNTQNDVSEQKKVLATSQMQGVGQRLNIMG